MTMDEFEIKIGYENMNIDEVMSLLRQTYWAKDRTKEVMDEAMRSCICFGAFLKETGKQIGFARALSDNSTTYYLADVIVDEKYRGIGAGAAIVKAVVEHEKLRDLRGILITKTAEGLYGKFGFNECDSTFMSKARKGD